MFIYPDIAKLLLRLGLGVMMLFHGVHKIISGIDGVRALVLKAGFLEFLAYGVFIGEVVAPIFIILGLYARVASFVVAMNMIVAIYLAYASEIFALNKFGAPVIELPLFYLLLSVIIILLGSGKFAVNNK